MIIEILTGSSISSGGAPPSWSEYQSLHKGLQSRPITKVAYLAAVHVLDLSRQSVARCPVFNHSRSMTDVILPLNGLHRYQLHAEGSSVFIW